MADPALVPLDAVERVLGAVAGGAVKGSEPALLKSWHRNDVWRVRVALPAGAPGRPGALGALESVIVKRFKSEPARGLDEWAALEHLGSLGLASAFAPGFLGGDLERGCFVMEDLGSGPSLEDLLRSCQAGAAARAGDALVAIARVTGALHAAGDSLRAAPAALGAWLEATGAAAATGLEAAGAALARVAEDPGDWATLTHGDMAPSNNLLAADGWRLLDFEYAGVRHALYDTLLWTLFCPFSASLIERADEAYRAVVARAFPAARDDREYARARAQVAAARTLDLLRWEPPALLARDHGWAPGLTARRAVLWHLARFLVLAEGGAPALAPITASLGALERSLRARWSAERELLWPASSPDRL